ncbi:MAG TPA: chromosome segregation protein SMC [Candidatus Ozemobacteraceae bacterium]|nr:chromosome segregation protein SMC [Candidatus Ozemobacteraceae bacterium]
MYLKSLEIMGFKSFGRKTVFDFQPGITAIIGPNGSGKSNVCDAIRWVLGEQSAKALRGNKMAEVIFAGSPSLRSAAFAQVKLILDNEDRMMPLDFSEVTIGRQLFKSGESNYLVNGTRSLLNDIKEMLMDTGIGKDGYSVIGQGDIEDIIFQRTQTRRALIEEAAGITKFKHRKANTLTKLDHTKANITRLQDIIGEIQNQLGPLSEQAEKTRRYQTLAAEIRALEIDLVLFDLSQLYGDAENVDSMRRGLLAKVAEIEKFLEEIDSRKSGVREKVQEFENQLQTRQSDSRKVAATIDETRGRMGLLREEARGHESRRQAIADEMTGIDKMLADGGQEITDAENRLRDAETEESAVAGRMAEIEANTGKVQAELDAHLKSVGQDRESSYKIAAQMSEKKTTINTSNQQIQILDRQLEKGSGDVTTLEAVIDKLATEKTGIEKELKAMETTIADEGTRLADDQARANKLDKDLRRAEEELSGTVDQFKVLTARRNILEELKNRSDSGIHRGVREALALKDRELPGICGMVGDLITVPKGYEMAFETALGGSIQDIVTRDAATAQRAIAVLKERKAGRATFLPIDMIQPPARLEAVRAKGCLGVALDLVQYDAQYYTIMNFLLGRILVFENLDDAVAYSRSTRNFNRIVTLEGDIVRSSGAMTGGAEGQKSAGLLARKRELEEAEARIQTLAAAEKKLSVQVVRLRNERVALGQVIRQREESLSRTRQSMEFFQKRLVITDGDLATRRNEFQNLDINRREIQKELERIRQVQAAAQQELTLLESQNIELTARLQEMSGRESAIQTRLASLRGLHADEKVTQGQIAERKKALKKEIDAAMRRRRDAQERRDRAGEEVARLEQLRKEAEAGIAAFQNEIQTLEARKAELEKAYETLQAEYRACSKELETLDHTWQSRSKIAESTRTKLGELDVKLAEVKTHIANKESILRSEYEFDPAQIGTQLRKYESRDVLSGQIAERRGEQQRLEPVNPLAIEEYEKTKERFEFLNGQVRDMTEAAVSLEQVIAEIEKISSERFMETFGQIDSAFGQIFQVVFPGGNARLKLTTPELPLESNVEIVCQLPGKKLSTIELFSGGEKALISIALLFSILQVKPPAFCILDEIEAALDEANVKRFTRLLRNFADKTQFFVITHNKETMQAVDVIYGITLEKTGTSRQISIRLEDQEKIREFTARKGVSVTERLKAVAAADRAQTADAGPYQEPRETAS